jgi:Rha family phage regulatory protein
MSKKPILVGNIGRPETPDVSELVYLADSTLSTDSQRVAKHFGKRHANLLRAFDRLECSDEFRQLNFELANELDEQGKPRRMVRMTKDGFVFLAMGLTGKEAARIKEAYINAFNSMAGQLQGISMSLWERRFQIEKRDDLSFHWASFGARKMNERRRDLPIIKSAFALIDSQLQPALFEGAVGVGRPPASNDAKVGKAAKKSTTRKRA